MGRSDIVEQDSLERAESSSRAGAYLELTKPRVTLLVVVTAAAGFYMASPGPPALLLLLHACAGTALLSGGTAVLNQVLERDADGRMHRTRSRPLPSGRLESPRASVFGILLVAAGTLYLALLTNGLAALLGALTSVLYLFVYTPLKARTALCTTVGAIAGALPPLIGWAAAAGGLDLQALLLFAILFVWQYPHTLAISWIYREDYRRGGFAMLALRDPDGRRTGQRILLSSVVLVLLSLIPAISGLAGMAYLAGAAAMGLILVRAGWSVAARASAQAARRVLHASVVYLPLLLALMAADKL